MTPQQRYRIAFFSLGWLVLIGLLFRVGMGRGFQIVYGRVASGLTSMTQYFSDAEGEALHKLRKSARREYLEPLQPMLSSVQELRNPSVMLFGAYDGGFPTTFHGFTQLEEDLRFRFPIISFYSAWGDGPDQQFPLRMVRTIDQLGSVPMITWEPWVTDFDENLRPNLPPRAEREYASLAAIARGEYDFYIAPWATAAAKFGKPIFLRFAHEMNDPYRYPWGPQNGNRPDDFVAAWKHVHNIFQKMSATNVIWVWSPHISMPWFEFYYPGPEFVDWVGFGVLNYGTVASWSRWWSFHQIVEKSYKALADLKKPLMISEFGCLGAGGSMEEWYRQALYHLDHSYGRIRAIILFNQPHDITTTPSALNWSILQDPKTTQLLAGELARQSML